MSLESHKISRVSIHSGSWTGVCARITLVFPAFSEMQERGKAFRGRARVDDTESGQGAELADIPACPRASHVIPSPLALLLFLVPLDHTLGCVKAECAPMLPTHKNIRSTKASFPQWRRYSHFSSALPQEHPHSGQPETVPGIHLSHPQSSQVTRKLQGLGA